jgi:hypothetical protein
MNRKRIFSICLVFAVLTTISFIRTSAASNTSTLDTGTLQSITINTDPTTKVTDVLIVLVDAAGQAQEVRISLDTAINLGLVTPEPNDQMIGQSVAIPNTDPLNPTFVLSGILNSLAVVNDPVTGIPSFTVTLTDTLGVVNTVSLSAADALSLGLISATPNPAKIGTPVVIDPLLILGSTSYSKEVSKLGSYFGATLGVTMDELAAYKDAGYGYGVITQACWMTIELNGNAALLDQILSAKKTGDFSTIILPDGTTATSWGQLRKLALPDAHQNLGSIMSGKATPLPALTPTPTTTPTPTSTSQTLHGNGNRNGNGNGNHGGNGNGHGRNK